MLNNPNNTFYVLFTLLELEVFLLWIESQQSEVNSTAVVFTVTLATASANKNHATECRRHWNRSHFLTRSEIWRLPANHLSPGRSNPPSFSSDVPLGAWVPSTLLTNQLLRIIQHAILLALCILS